MVLKTLQNSPPPRILATRPVRNVRLTPRQGDNRMTSTPLVAPISLSTDLLTGAEWSPAHTRELLHPCQALADFFTLQERFGDLRGFKLTYVGDGNNVCHSLMYLAARLGVHIRIATPHDYTPAAEVVADSKRVARETKAKIELLTDPREAVTGAMAVYTDAWTSMGFEAEEETRTKIFEPYQVNPELMSLAAPDAVFMHCLPAHRGLEVTPEVLDGPQSVVLDQSENRMYVQKAILHTLF